MSVAVIHTEEVEEKVSPFQDAYFGFDPTDYMAVGKPQGYNPEPPILPNYCNTVLDCAVLFGNSSLAAMYGWRFPRSCEFWERKCPLTDEERKATLLNKRIKMIGLDGIQAAIDYSKRMNIIDEGIVQNFEHPIADATKMALEEADVWILQQCLSYMPFDNLKVWIEAFTKDRSRPKRFIYDFNPFFDKRDMSPGNLFKDVKDWSVSTEKFYKYRNKTEAEFQESQENGRDMCVIHYVVDFA